MSDLTICLFSSRTFARSTNDPWFLVIESGSSLILSTILFLASLVARYTSGEGRSMTPRPNLENWVVLIGLSGLSFSSCCALVSWPAAKVFSFVIWESTNLLTFFTSFLFFSSGFSVRLGLRISLSSIDMALLGYVGTLYSLFLLCLLCYDWLPVTTAGSHTRELFIE